MVEYLVLILFACAWWSYVWEAGLAPTIRAELRWGLFAARDQLRAARASMGNAIPKALYDDLQHSINWTAVNMDTLTISNLIEANRLLKTDSEVRRRVEQRQALFESCQIEDVGTVRWKTNRIGMAAFAANWMGWAILVLPLVICWALLSKIKKIVKAVLVFPSSAAEKVFGENRAVAHAR